MKKVALFLLILFFMGMNLVSAQTRVITGKVTSAEDNKGIPGVSVSVKGTTLGTITNVDGNFELNVPGDAKVLVLSFVGMKTQEISIGAGSFFNVSLEPDLVGIEEVVVTALGMTSEKKSLGYSVQEVGSDVLSTRPNADIVNSLAGRTSGVQIISSAGDAGASTFMTIRGAASITGNNQPLFVVNGLPIISGGGAG